MVSVVNIRGDKKNCDVYIGRPSYLGNPFVLGRDGSREAVIAKYRAWLAQKMLTDTPQRQEIQRLAALSKKRTLRLGCWCAPLACHGDVIAEVIAKL